MEVEIPGDVFADPVRLEVSEREMRILRALQEHGPLTRKEMAFRLGGIETETGVNATLNKLKRNTLVNITTGSHGRWVIAPGGLYALAQYLPPAMRS